MKLLGDMGKKEVIVNADDFGMNEEATQGILLAVKRGYVNSVSVCVTMANNPARLAKDVALLDVVYLGLHIDLTEGGPVEDKVHLRSLLTDQGQFRPARESLGLEAALNEEAIRDDIQSQILRFQSWFGRLPTHLDCHQHFAYLSPIAFAALLEASKVTGIPIRSARPFVDPARLTTFVQRVKQRYGVEVPFVPAARAAEIRFIYEKSKPCERTGDVLIDCDFSDGLQNSIADRLRGRSFQSVEVVCHPRFADASKTVLF